MKIQKMQWMSLFLLCLWSKFQEFNETFLYYDIFKNNKIQTKIYDKLLIAIWLPLSFYRAFLYHYQPCLVKFVLIINGRTKCHFDNLVNKVPFLRYKRTLNEQKMLSWLVLKYGFCTCNYTIQNLFDTSNCFILSHLKNRCQIKSILSILIKTVFCYNGYNHHFENLRCKEFSNIFPLLRKITNLNIKRYLPGWSSASYLLRFSYFS